MKYLSIIPVLAVLMAGTAHAQNYVELRGGAVWLQDMETFDPGAFGTPSGTLEIATDQGWLAAVAFGRHFGSSFRAEIELAHRDLDADTLNGSIVNTAPPPTLLPLNATIAGGVTIDSLMVNGYADLASPGVRLVPFIGAGIGAASVKTEIDGQSRTDMMTAIRLAAGLAYAVTPALDMTVAADMFFADSGIPIGTTDVQSYSVTAGLRFNF